VADLVSHLERDGVAACGTRMRTFWSGCWSDEPTCKHCRRIKASGTQSRVEAISCRRRIVDKLRRLYPAAGPWRYDPLEACWRCRDGWAVRAYEPTALDDGVVTEYRRVDTQEVLNLFPPFRLKMLPPVETR
jgi:hypothetical protein